MRKSIVFFFILVFLWTPATHLLGCTIVMAAKDGLILVGNNEDRKFFGTTVAFLQPTERYYGRIVFGYTDAVGQGGSALTVYSNVYDLKKGIVYVYNRTDFTNPLILDLAKEMNNGNRTLDLPDLFTEKIR